MCFVNRHFQTLDHFAGLQLVIAFIIALFAIAACHCIFDSKFLNAAVQLQSHKAL